MAQPDAPIYGNNWSDEAKRLRRLLEEVDAERPDPVLPDAPISGDPVVDLGMVDCE